VSATVTVRGTAQTSPTPPVSALVWVSTVLSHSGRHCEAPCESHSTSQNRQYSTSHYKESLCSSNCSSNSLVGYRRAPCASGAGGQLPLRVLTSAAERAQGSRLSREASRRTQSCASTGGAARHAWRPAGGEGAGMVRAERGGGYPSNHPSRHPSRYPGSRSLPGRAECEGSEGASLQAAEEGEALAVPSRPGARGSPRAPCSPERSPTACPRGEWRASQSPGGQTEFRQAGRPQPAWRLLPGWGCEEGAAPEPLGCTRPQQPLPRDSSLTHCSRDTPGDAPAGLSPGGRPCPGGQSLRGSPPPQQLTFQRLTELILQGLTEPILR